MEGQPERTKTAFHGARKKRRNQVAKPKFSNKLRQVGDEGLEPPAYSPHETTIPNQGGAEPGAHCEPSGIIDPNLQTIVDAWAELPGETKADILAMIHAVDQ